jgi:hypothetical protein
MIPVLFTHAKKYAFGLSDCKQIYLVRYLRDLRLSLHKPTLPEGVHLIAAGDECNAILSEAGLLGPLLQSMASDMQGAIEKQLMTYPRYAKQMEEIRKQGIIRGAI